MERFLQRKSDFYNALERMRILQEISITRLKMNMLIYLNN